MGDDEQSGGEWPGAVREVLGEGGGDGAPLAEWLAGFVAERPVARGEGIAGALRPARELCKSLAGLGVAMTPEQEGELELALLVDCLEPAAPPRHEVVLGLRRALLARSEDPLDHAAALLDETGQRHLTMVARPPCADLAREAASGLAQKAGEPGGKLLDRLEGTILEIQMLALATLPGTRPPLELLAEAVDDALGRGRRALSLSGRCEEAWEVQRSGFLGHDELVGDLFGPLLVVEAAARAGLDVTACLERVTGTRAGEGLRCYRGCAGMPHDSDDAAALLLAAAGGPGAVPETLLTEARTVLRAAVGPEGAIATWVVLPGATTAMPLEDWLWQRCAGVGARVILAMAADVDGRWSTEELGRCAAMLAGQADCDGGFTASYYPSRVVATSLAMQALSAPAVGDDEACSRAVSGAREWLLAQHEPSGAFGGTALETATAMVALVDSGELDEGTAAEGAAALVGLQRWDGGWPPSPFFHCPFPRDGVGVFSASMVTTAVAVAALTEARKLLTLPRADPPRPESA